jgi:hypothetical protein
MRSLPLLFAFVGATAAVQAQANCSAGASPTRALATQTPFTGGSLYGHPNYPNPPGATYTGFSFLFDVTLPTPINVSSIDIDLYDAGGLVDLGNGTLVTSPNQVGATANVELFLLPAPAWSGGETTPSAWVLLGTGTLTVGIAHAHSPIVFTTPASLPSGQWGIALKVDMTTNGPSPGPLHPMLNVVPPPASYSDGVLTITNLVFQRETWTATIAPANTQNLEFHYVVPTGFAQWTSFGTACVSPNVPVLGLLSRPVIGTTVTFQTSNILAGTPLNFWLFGFAPDATGLELSSFGLPGCRLYLQLGSNIVLNVTTVTNGLATTSIAIPNDPSYSGIVLFAQAAPVTGGFNAGGFFASNAVCVALGPF